MEKLKARFLFAFLSLITLALSICVLSGCKTASESRYQLYSVNGVNITNLTSENCVLCNFTTVPDRYMVGLSGICASTNGTIRCHRTFPNTFNITAATIAAITATNSSDLPAIYTNQSEQYTKTISMSHTRTKRLSEAVCSILIASVILSFFFLILGFFIKARLLSIFVCLDLSALCAVMVMVYLINRNEIASAKDEFFGIVSPHSAIKFELGFWLLVCAVASRFLSAGPAIFLKPKIKEDREQHWPVQRLQHQQRQDQQQLDQHLQTQEQQQEWEDQRWEEQQQQWQEQGEQLSTIRISKSLRDIHDVDDDLYASLTSKIASTISRLRDAVQTYPEQSIVDDGCKRLFTRIRDDERLASIMPHHFYQQSVPFFLGTHLEATGIPPGPLLYENCPYREETPALESRSRGVYLVIVSECCHGSRSPNSTTEYTYVGSGRSSEGVMLRVKEHNNPEYRNSTPSELYRAWDHLIAPCVAIYQLAEWDPLPWGRHPGSGEGFDEILLAEAIWQVVLQTSARRNMSEFTQHIRDRGNGDADLVSDVWTGCNVNSALEKFKKGGRNRRVY